MSCKIIKQLSCIFSILKYFIESFFFTSGRIFDEMHFTLRELKLTRAAIDPAVTCNDILSQCPVIKPITFELHIRFRD